MELMVVIGILALLVAIVLPSANALSRSAATTLERSAARSLIGAWRSWSFDHDGQLLVGQIDGGEIPGHEAPLQWNGTIIPDVARRRWMWRLFSYLENPVDTLWVNDMHQFWQQQLANTSDPSAAVYMATLHSSFGLNADYLGGRQSGDCDVWMLDQFIHSQDPSAPPLAAETISMLRRPADLIAFASSRGRRGGGTDNDILEGFWRLETPYKPAAGSSQPQWATTDTGEFIMPTAETDPAFTGGFLSARHNGRVLIAAPDGHVAVEPFEALANMRRWADQATDPLWCPSINSLR